MCLFARIHSFMWAVVSEFVADDGLLCSVLSISVWPFSNKSHHFLIAWCDINEGKTTYWAPINNQTNCIPQFRWHLATFFCAECMNSALKKVTECYRNCRMQFDCLLTLNMLFFSHYHLLQASSHLMWYCIFTINFMQLLIHFSAVTSFLPQKINQCTHFRFGHPFSCRDTFMTDYQKIMKLPHESCYITWYR